MATEYDLLRSLLSYSEKHNQHTVKPFDQLIRIRKLLSLLRIRARYAGTSPDDRQAQTRKTQMS
jgi:hypothetical protein